MATPPQSDPRDAVVKLPDCSQIALELADGVLHLTLNRPAQRNAMTQTMLGEIDAALDAVAPHETVRAIVLRGAGGHFCAGGDIRDMQAAQDAPVAGAADPLFALNRAFGRLVARVDAAPQVVIACLEGAVMGGGLGLACVSDIAIADRAARFAMPETGLGLPPAQIAPFVVARIGLAQARRLVLTGAALDGAEAARLGLVHFVTDEPEAMAERLREQLTRVRRCAPRANRVSKDLLLKVGAMERDALLDQAARSFAEAVRGDEGREGARAFLERRLPSWAAAD